MFKEKFQQGRSCFYRPCHFKAQHATANPPNYSTRNFVKMPYFSTKEHYHFVKAQKNLSIVTDE